MRPTVLVVEEGEASAALINLYLLLAGYRPVTFSGTSCREDVDRWLADGNLPDASILSLVAVGASCGEWKKRLRNCSGEPLIFFMADSKSSGRGCVNFFDDGCFLLEKPVKFSSVVEGIATALRLKEQKKDGFVAEEGSLQRVRDVSGAVPVQGC